MQTFLPIATTDFRDIAKVLDNKRLNKQALEGWQILMTLLELDPEGNRRIPKGWVNHPAVRMWAGYEPVLVRYVLSMVEEWKRRGFNSTIDVKTWKTVEAASSEGSIFMEEDDIYPAWINDNNLFENIAASHRLALLVKDYNWYSQFEWPEKYGKPTTEYNYIWPV